MRLVVLRTFWHLISIIHHRLLPEAAVREPLERMIQFCYDLQQSYSTSITGARGNLKSFQEKERLELIKLVHAVYKKLNHNPALLNLFMHPNKGLSGPKSTLTLFTMLYPYISSEIPSVFHRQFEEVSRESLLIAFTLIAQDEFFSRYVIEDSGFCEFFVNMLVENFCAISVENLELLSPKSDISGSSLDISQDFESSSFYANWNLLNTILKALVTPNSFMRKDYSMPGASLLEHLVEKIASTLFKNCMLKKIEELIDDNFRAHKQSNLFILLEFLHATLSVVEEELLMARILFVLFQDSSGKFRNFIERHTRAKSDDLSISAWKILDALISSFTSCSFEYLIFSNLPKSDNYLLPSIETINLVLDKMLSWSKKVDDMWYGEEITSNSPTSRSSSPVHRSELWAMNSRSYDLYFVEAQEKNQEFIFAYDQWSYCMKNFGQKENSAYSRAVEIVKCIPPINLPQILIDEMETFYFNSPKKNLIISSIISKISHLPDTRTIGWILDVKADGIAETNIPKSPVFSKHSLMAVLYELYNQSSNYCNNIEKFEENVRLIRNYCGDDMITILHNLSTGGFLDSESKLEASFDSLALKGDTNKEAETSNSASRALPTFSTFLPAYLILAEFSKELSAILFIVHRYMKMIIEVSKDKEISKQIELKE